MEKLFEIHLPNLILFVRQFKMPGSNANKLPWVVLQTSGTGEFCDLTNIAPPALIYECYYIVSGPKP